MLTGVPRVVWVLAAGRFVTSITSFLVLFLTLYLSGPRQRPVTEAGVIAGAFGLGLLAGNFTGGRWGDRFGHRRVLLLSSTVAGIATAAVPWLPVPVLAVALPLIAYGDATSGVSVGALSAQAVDRGDRRRAVAIGRAASNAGFVVGPPLAALVIAVNFDALFVVEGALTIAVRFAVGAALPKDEPAAHAERPRGGVWQALRHDRALLVLLAGVVLADLVYRQMYATVPLRLRDAGEPVALYTAILAIGSALILAFEIPVTLRLRHRAAQPIIAAGYVLVGIGFALFGLPVSIGTAVLAMVVLTVGEILYKTTATAHVLDSAPDHLLGQYQGLYTGAATSGTMLAAPVGTALYAAAPALLWPACLAVTVVAAGAVLVSRRAAPASAPRRAT